MCDKILLVGSIGSNSETSINYSSQTTIVARYNVDIHRKSEEETAPNKILSILIPLYQLKPIRVLFITTILFSCSYGVLLAFHLNNSYAFALNNSSAGKNTGLVQSSGTSNLTIPVMTKLSNNGTYIVQLKWSNPTSIQSPNLRAGKGFDMQVVFLNASAPAPNAKSVPKTETNVSGETGREIGFTQTGIIQRLIPVDSFDITIYDSKGHVLWSKTHQIPRAGSEFERVTFSKQYRGDITIQISNIKSAAAKAARGTTIDSVKFSTRVS